MDEADAPQEAIPPKEGEAPDRPALPQITEGDGLGGTPTVRVETSPPASGGVRQVSYYREEIYEGPCPHPEHLRQMAEIYSDAPRIIFENYDEQSKHRRKMEELVIGSQVKLASRGQLIGGAIGMVGMVGSMILIGLGNAGAGLAVLGFDLVALVGVFVLGRRAEAKERTEKAVVQAKIDRNEPVESLDTATDSESMPLDDPT